VPASRFLFLVAGILGLLALFRPLVGVGRGLVHVELSAYELSFGLTRTHAIIEKQLPQIAERHLPPDVRETRDDVKLVAEASRGAALAFVPAALLLVLGVVAAARKRTSRIEGAIAMLLGLASIAAWFGLRYGVAYGIREEPALARLHLDLRIGAHLLIVVGACAIVGGLVALVRRRADA